MRHSGIRVCLSWFSWHSYVEIFCYSLIRFFDKILQLHKCTQIVLNGIRQVVNRIKTSYASDIFFVYQVTTWQNLTAAWSGISL